MHHPGGDVDEEEAGGRQGDGGMWEIPMLNFAVNLKLL